MGMLSLKLYTDTTLYQSALRRAHWTTTRPATKLQFYRWASTIHRAHLYHALPIPTIGGKSPCSLYHGLNKLFTLTSELTMYHGPFSTTMEKSVADSFSDGK